MRPVKYQLGDKPPKPGADSEGEANGEAYSADSELITETSAAEAESEAKHMEGRKGMSPVLADVQTKVLPRVLDRVDAEAASKLSHDELCEEFRPVVIEVLNELKLTLNRTEQAALEKNLVDELLGLGPLEPLLADPTVTDVLVNGPNQVYVERHGKLEMTGVHFRDAEHVMNVAQRICNRIGRRVDQSSPLADARLEDGSRVNVIIPPLALRGPTISIRKFSKKPLDLDKMVKQNNLSAQMAKLLKIAAYCRLNIIVSGGTGSGKTTLLNALSKMIDQGERVVTIEDAAELQMQQPHVVPLETRPKNLEGEGEITIRDLVINALRMRPDRIILGEVRGPECIDMLQAMNTGHEGSMCTLHANSTREAMTRMENMATMSGLKYPLSAIRTQIAEALDMIVQISRMRDGMRRITRITEVVGMEGDVIVAQDLYKFVYDHDSEEGEMIGTFENTGLRPACYEKVRGFGLEQSLMETLK